MVRLQFITEQTSPDYHNLECILLSQLCLEYADVLFTSYSSPIITSIITFIIYLLLYQAITGVISEALHSHGCDIQSDIW